VSKALTAIVALALVATLSLVPESTPIAGSSRATAADCAWQRHSKRIVKQVKREGHVRRLVRVKHWWTCNPLAAAPVIEPPAPAPAPNPGPTPEPVPTIARLSVKAEDESEPWSFTLSRSNVAAGEVIVELNNQGGDPHNLNLRREGDVSPPLEISEAGPLEHRTGRFTLAAGTYQLWCSLPEHEEKGMHTTLVVDAG
jgi:plastocyanin